MLLWFPVHDGTYSLRDVLSHYTTEVPAQSDYPLDVTETVPSIKGKIRWALK
ncbi:hypothetical protein BV22DRAFT_1039600 [Leucogyrophana mollusca]|uniref:Uncharacterized protein n=1 Tax=Leucogyrophana mollusca TaxID=85980 RepID=A0ACB8B5Z8_9AGAM|nr:hypothetical protein BV22DRAFT_1039600 [Leucogyrophana mollusca]